MSGFQLRSAVADITWTHRRSLWLTWTKNWGSFVWGDPVQKWRDLVFQGMNIAPAWVTSYIKSARTSQMQNITLLVPQTNLDMPHLVIRNTKSALIFTFPSNWKVDCLRPAFSTKSSGKEEGERGSILLIRCPDSHVFIPNQNNPISMCNLTNAYSVVLEKNGFWRSGGIFKYTLGYFGSGRHV